MDDETRAAVDRLAAAALAQEAQLHATRLLLAEALAMAPIDLETLALRVMGQRQAAAPAALRAGVQPAILAEVLRQAELLLETAGRRRREVPPDG